MNESKRVVLDALPPGGTSDAALSLADAARWAIALSAQVQEQSAPEVTIRLNAPQAGATSGNGASVADVVSWALPTAATGAGGNSPTIVGEADSSRSGATNRAEASLADVVSRSLPALAPEMGEDVSKIAVQLDPLRALVEKQTGTVTENTQAVAQNTVSQTHEGAASTVGAVAKTAAKTILGGLTLVPLVSALVGLFKGDKPEPPPLAAYALPPAIQFQGAVQQDNSQGILPADYGQDGLPRAIPQGAQYYATPVTVQVQAIDSRSFMDHSEDIARAVRDALLNAHALGDVVSEL